jgi:hypothetical protein
MLWKHELDGGFADLHAMGKWRKRCRCRTQGKLSPIHDHPLYAQFSAECPVYRLMDSGGEVPNLLRCDVNRLTGSS